jgi:hypothetical protein
VHGRAVDRHYKSHGALIHGCFQAQAEAEAAWVVRRKTALEEAAVATAGRQAIETKMVEQLATTATRMSEAEAAWRQRHADTAIQHAAAVAKLREEQEVIL